MSATVKMEKIRATDTKIALDDNGEKISSGLIECSVNMNVSLSNAKRSKIFQRAQSLLILILAIVFAILCFHLKREVRALEVQMNSANSNLIMLMMRYDKLNKNFNRIWYHRAGNQNRSGVSNSAMKFDAKVLGHRRPSSWDESVISDVLSRLKSSTVNAKGPRRPNATVVEAERASDEGSSPDNVENAIGETRFLDAGVEREDADTDRYERAIAAFEQRNRDSIATLPDQRDDTEMRNKTRGGRSRRDEGRGKKRGKVKRRLKSGRRRLGPLVATFVGGIPELDIADKVHVGPWVRGTRHESRYAFNKFHLVENKRSIEITVSGLYMISAQIYYYGQHTHYSYWITLNSEGQADTQKLTKCAAVGDPSSSEITCSTSVVMSLQPGDRLHIEQQERDRLINLREGHSFVQIVLLSGESP